MIKISGFDGISVTDIHTGNMSVGCHLSLISGIDLNECLIENKIGNLK